MSRTSSLRGWVSEAGDIRTTPSGRAMSVDGGGHGALGSPGGGGGLKRNKPTTCLSPACVQSVSQDSHPLAPSQATAHPGPFPFVPLCPPWLCSVSFILSFLAAVRPGCPGDTSELGTVILPRGLFPIPEQSLTTAPLRNEETSKCIAVLL